MIRSRRSLTPAQASAALGVSAKALRLYEKRGLILPDRSRTGWRAYGAEAMARAAEIVALRSLGLGLAQVACILGRNAHDLDAALAALEARLHVQGLQVASVLERVQSRRADLARGHAQEPASALAQDGQAHDTQAVSFALPWPWGRERFTLGDIPRLAFITGPLGCGKTRFAEQLAARLPDAAFIGLDRLSSPTFARSLAEDAALANRVEFTLRQLVEDGAARSDALTVLLVALETDVPKVLLIEMVEEGLSPSTQAALMVHLRRRESHKRALFLMTRSSAILDLDALRSSEIVILCPANHSPPFRVVPHPGGHGYESVATCLASPEVRARSASIPSTNPTEKPRRITAGLSGSSAT